MKKKLKSDSPLRAATCSPSSDADYACHCIDQLASACKLNPKAYHLSGKEKVRKLESEMNRYREALDRIARPIWWMQEDAKRIGHTLNGAMAASLADSGNYLRNIAEKALSQENASLSHGDESAR